MRRRRAPALAVMLGALASLVTAVPARAQRSCAGRPIRRITVRTAPVLLDEGHPYSPIIQWFADGLSWQTRPEVVRRELRFEAGEPCDPYRLSESARVLRAQPYLRTADITAAPAPGDSVDVDVRTRDDWALNGSLRVSTSGPRGFRALRVTENDLLGLGALGQVRYDYYGRHAGLVFDVMDRQLFGSRTRAELLGGRSGVGPDWEFSLRRALESELDRVGWHASVRYREEPFTFSAPAFGAVVQPLVSEGTELAVVGRLGRRGRQLLAGLALSAERLFVTDDVQATEASDDSAAGAQLAGKFTERRAAMASAIVGARAVRFVSRRGVDAVHAPEDVREGVEVLAIAGHTLGVSPRAPRAVFALADLYAGAEPGSGTLVFLRARMEGRRLLDSLAWDGVLASADAFLYRRLGSRAGLFVSAQGAGGWHMSTPFQLLLSSPRTLRGFGLYALPVGRRVVVQSEHRYFLGSLFRALDVGTAAFVDVGRGWAGDAPFGLNTGTLVAVGAGLRLAFPSGSRFTTRVDFAVPARGGRGSELRIGVGQQFGVFASAPGDVERSRLPISTIALFNFRRY